jgi:hypothetical protein
MKRIIGTMAVAFSCLMLSAPSLAVTSVKGKVASCTNFSQYFKFTNSYHEGQYAFFATAKNFNVNTTMQGWPTIPAGESETYQNTFTSDQQAILTGEAFFVGASKKPKTLCGITFACECSADSGCVYDVTTVGTRCDIKQGTGDEGSPFAINLT